MTSLPFIPDSEIEIAIINNESEKRSVIKSITEGTSATAVYINPVEQEIKHIVFVIEGIQTDLINFFFQHFSLEKQNHQYTIISIQPIRKKVIKDELAFIEKLRSRWTSFGFIKIHDYNIKSILYPLGRSSANTLIVMSVNKTQLMLFHKKDASMIFTGKNSLLLILKEIVRQ